MEPLHAAECMQTNIGNLPIGSMLRIKSQKTMEHLPHFTSATGNESVSCKLSCWAFNKPKLSSPDIWKSVCVRACCCQQCDAACACVSERASVCLCAFVRAINLNHQRCCLDQWESIYCWVCVWKEKSASQRVSWLFMSLEKISSPSIQLVEADSERMTVMIITATVALYSWLWRWR